ncbi:dipeptide ABC transporter ATP-binding protein [Agromyces cerinus]|uniref:Peptide/nickel transport system ATP-binding protein n=1 Tax=Agromyces cerinus subsp. cerinus TaxID=232089 RepID=A0A1N6DVE3_9MICO|nr:ABC transporter ATP-binding protein [Agromyces cerinus]SIN74759.1 peptide/nickel transport system ATP-binding protein [Agromyces cerinus subsp. cerinus]
MTNTPAPALEVAQLRVGFGGTDVVHGIDLTIMPGECVAIVGESGSGKSVTARALLGMAGADSRTSAEHLRIDGLDLGAASEREWRRERGRRAGLILQDALGSLDPLRTVGREIEDPLRIHLRLPASERRARVLRLLADVGMPDPVSAVRRRSGELSGGLRQRALIAAAIALDPPLLIADEPTTALDVTVQARILALLDEIRERGTGVLLISHDLAVVSRMADRILVMREGRIIEQGSTGEVLEAPREDYTRSLIAAVPAEVPRGVRLSATPMRPATQSGALPTISSPLRPSHDPAIRTTPLLELSHLTKTFAVPGGRFTAVDDVSLSLHRGETLGLVGESGSGKTTVARLALALTTPDSGSVRFDGEEWSALDERQRRPTRHRIGAIYQDPLGSFDPRWNVGRLLADAVRGAREAGTSDVSAGPTAPVVAVLLDQVGLAASVADRKPMTLSGGQRQRVAIARALAGSPELLICDEPVSALDVTIQAQILDLLDDIQRERGLALLFISHDLGVVHHMADHVAVMRAGRIVESGDAGRVFTQPGHPYTAQLVADSPRLAT